MKESPLEASLWVQIEQDGLPLPDRWQCLIPGKKSHFDMSWPDRRVALEIQGGEWVNGAHTRGTGYTRDCEKGNALTLLDWAVYYVTGSMVRDGRALELLRKVLA